MYYEEKLICGVLHYRLNTNSFWITVSNDVNTCCQLHDLCALRDGSTICNSDT